MGRQLLEPEAYRLLAGYGVPVPPWRWVRTPEEAAQAATAVGLPVVVKVVSAQVAHKSDVGGVRVGVPSPAEAEEACREVAASVASCCPGAHLDGWLVCRQCKGVELVAGVARDPVFGPVLMFGSGGILVELLRDVVFRALPLAEADALEMVEETRASLLLGGVRGQPAADRKAVVRLLLALARLAEENPRVDEVDLNPVLASPEGVVAVDARVIVED